MATPAPPRDPELERVRTFATILDNYLVDPILGVVLPGAGDVLGALLGVYTVSVALRRKISPVVIARMFLNLAVDALVGVVPVLGDVFDFGFRANVRNAHLLADRAGHGGQARARDWLAVVGAAALFVGTLGLVIYGAIALVRAIF